MFPPDVDASPYNTTAIISNNPPKLIHRENTRLSEQDKSLSDIHELSAPSSPTRSHIEAVINGTPCEYNKKMLHEYRINYMIIDRPNSLKNNFSLLPSMPSPTPSDLGSAGIKQLMTWGALNSTPRIISTANEPSNIVTPNTPFHLPSPSSREVIGMKLSSKASKSLREKANLIAGGSMPPPSWTPRRVDAIGTLTPAAKRLLNRTTAGVASIRRADAMGRTAGWDNSSKAKERDMQKVRWTPSPSPVIRKRT